VAHACIPTSEPAVTRAVRVMSYNVHGCVGSDFRLDPLRVARVIADCAPDVVALQELDVERARSGRVDQPRSLADRLGMQLAFCSARECDGGRYGNAVLSRHPIEEMRAACLPQPAKSREQRAVQWVRVLAPGLPLNVVNTHLGLDHGERMAHAAAIVGHEWVHEARALGPTVLCGDFNAGPRSRVYRKLTSELRDAQRLVVGRGPRGTFPALFPLMRIDHVLVSPELTVRQCTVATGWRARLASDHLPLVVDLSVDASDSRRSSADRNEP
jgi:endonuclease/exonuclease/phosphatase family metal-dependent hydrolase